MHDPASKARQAVQDHVCGVLAGDVPSNRWIRLAASRWQADAARDDIRLDWDRVGAMVAFIEGLELVGFARGRRWQLLPWQVWFLAGCIGWRRADGTARTRTALLQVARKNGKSTLMAGLALWHLIGEAGSNGEAKIHVIANKAEQARIVLDTAREMARPLLPLRTTAGRKCIQHNKLVTDWGFMDAQCAAEKSLDGLDPSLWIGDEAAEWRGRFITKMTTANVSRPDGLGVMISTPGNNPDLVYAEKVRQCEAMLDGEAVLDDWHAAIYGIDDSDDPEDVACWGKANPSLGASLQLSVLERQWQAMRLSPLERIEFQRFHLARPVDVVGRWLDMRHWDAITEPPAIPDGADVWIGVDLSKSQDMSAVVICHPDAAGTAHLRGLYWYPAEFIHEREVTYQLPFRRFAEEGRLQLSPGGTINYQAIVDAIAGLRQRYNVRRVAVDPWNSQMFNQLLDAEFGKNAAGEHYVMEHSQGIATMAPACQFWQDLWTDRRIRHGGDPLLRAACANAAVRTDDAGNVRPVKSRSRGLIDPLVAAIMACHAWARDTGGAGPSMYESGGLL
jgi:phage terminase large subunit-like protein